MELWVTTARVSWHATWRTLLIIGRFKEVQKYGEKSNIQSGLENSC